MYATIILSEEPIMSANLGLPKGTRSLAADITPPECTKPILMMRMRGLFLAAVRTMVKHMSYPDDTTIMYEHLFWGALGLAPTQIVQIDEMNADFARVMDSLEGDNNGK